MQKGVWEAGTRLGRAWDGTGVPKPLELRRTSWNSAWGWSHCHLKEGGLEGVRESANGRDSGAERLDGVGAEGTGRRTEVQS